MATLVNTILNLLTNSFLITFFLCENLSNFCFKILINLLNVKTVGELSDMKVFQIFVSKFL